MCERQPQRPFLKPGFAWHSQGLANSKHQFLLMKISPEQSPALLRSFAITVLVLSPLGNSGFFFFSGSCLTGGRGMWEGDNQTKKSL